jgi:hypothetical protein
MRLRKQSAAPYRLPCVQNNPRPNAGKGGNSAKEQDYKQKKNRPRSLRSILQMMFYIINAHPRQGRVRKKYAILRIFFAGAGIKQVYLRENLVPSFPRRRESRWCCERFPHWIPACAGMTTVRFFLDRKSKRASAWPQEFLRQWLHSPAFPPPRFLACFRH